MSGSGMSAATARAISRDVADAAKWRALVAAVADIGPGFVWNLVGYDLNRIVRHDDPAGRALVQDVKAEIEARKEDE